MTPAEMRETAAQVCEDFDDGLPDVGGRCAAAIRALPLAEEAPTPREKLRRVREAREVLATARVAYVRPGIARVYNGATGGLMGEWRPSGVWVCMNPKAGGKRGPDGIAGLDARTWVLDTLRAEGWDVVEGEGDG